MYGVFKKHRGLKLIGLTVGLFALWFLAKPAASLIGGKSIDATSLIGSYADGKEHQIIIVDESKGKMISEGISEDFFFDLDLGTITCKGSRYSWTMKALKDGSIWNEFDESYLFRRESK